jgi:hypothetical protein
VTDQSVRVYDPAEAASLLRCKESWLKDKARRREIPFTLIGGAYRWTDAHLAEIIRLGEQAPPTQLPRRRIAPADDGTPLLRARPPRKARASGDEDTDAALSPPSPRDSLATRRYVNALPSTT